MRLIREKPEDVKAGIARLHAEAPIDEIVELDEQRRARLTEVEALKAERNEGSKAVARAKDAPNNAIAHRDHARARRQHHWPRRKPRKRSTRSSDDLLLTVPNLPLPDVPDGADESANVVIRGQSGEPPTLRLTAETALGDRPSNSASSTSSAV